MPTMTHQDWTCPECGAMTEGAAMPNRRHRTGCSWLRGLDANPDGTPREADAITADQWYWKDGETLQDERTG